MFFVGFKAPSFLHIFAIRKMKSRTLTNRLGKRSSINMLTFCIIKIFSQQVTEGGKKTANYELLYY